MPCRVRQCVIFFLSITFVGVRQTAAQGVSDWMQRGDTMIRSKRFEEAALAYRNATRLDPKSVGAWKGLVDASIEMGHLDDALDGCKAIVSIDPKNVGGHYVLGLLYLLYRNDRHAFNKQLMILSSLDPQSEQQLIEKQLSMRLMGAFNGIHSLVNFGDVAQIRHLLRKQPSVARTQDDDGDTPLHKAVRTLTSAPDANDIEIVSLLLKAGADRQKKNPAGYRPIDYVTSPEIADEEGRLPIHLAAITENEDWVRVLLDLGVPADLRTIDRAGQGATALFLAAYGGKESIVHLLLSRGANPDRECFGSATPLLVALDQGHIRVATALRRAGAKEPHRRSAGSSSSSSAWYMSAGTYKCTWYCTGGLSCANAPETSISFYAPSLDEAYRIGTDNAENHCKQFTTKGDSHAMWCDTEMSPAGKSCSRIK